MRPAYPATMLVRSAGPVVAIQPFQKLRRTVYRVLLQASRPELVLEAAEFLAEVLHRIELWFQCGPVSLVVLARYSDQGAEARAACRHHRSEFPDHRRRPMRRIAPGP